MSKSKASRHNNSAAEAARTALGDAQFATVARRLKTLRGLTPYEFVCHAWTKEPHRFRLDPSHHTPGPYT